MEDLFHLGIKALIRNREGKVLLLKINPESMKKFTEPYWDIPGGRIQKGESPETALQREVLEETGIQKLEDFKLLTTVLSNIRIPVGDSTVGLLLSVYEGFIYNVKDIILSEEHTEAKWFSITEASELLKIKYPQEFCNIVLSLKNAEKFSGKIVRDNIIDIIKKEGREPEFSILDDKEYPEELIKKISEEVDEYVHYNSIADLADIQEIILALAENRGVSQEELEKIRVEKRQKNGGFEKRIFLKN